jgi:hypothetical protein
VHTLYLIRGVPGSGKSELAYTMYSYGVVDVYFEADQYFELEDGYQFDATKLGKAHAYCQDRCKAHLNNSQSVAVSNTSPTEKEVEVYRQIAEQSGAKFVSIVLENRHGGHTQSRGKMLDVGLDSAYNIYGLHKFFSEQEVEACMQTKELFIADQHRTEKG